MKIRIPGLLLLGICALAAWRLHQLVVAPPRHGPTGFEFLLGALAFLSASAGAALTALGRGLFAPVPTPPRPWRVVQSGNEPTPARAATADPTNVQGDCAGILSAQAAAAEPASEKE